MRDKAFILIVQALLGIVALALIFFVSGADGYPVTAESRGDHF